MNTATQMVETVAVDNFELALAGWLACAQQLVDDHYSKHFPTLPGEQLTLERGRRYVRVVKSSKDEERGQRSVYCFIDAAPGPLHGTVLKAESWRKPAAGPRGNIFTGQMGVSAYGGLYAR